jgi:hypothetical protein
MKCAGVNIYGHPNIRGVDQHRLATKKFFYLQLKRNQLFHRLSAQQITIRLPAPSMTSENHYEKTFALKLFASHTTRINNRTILIISNPFHLLGVHFGEGHLEIQYGGHIT